MACKPEDGTLRPFFSSSFRRRNIFILCILRPLLIGLCQSFTQPLSKVDAKSEWLRPHIRFLKGVVREREKEECVYTVSIPSEFRLHLFFFFRAATGPSWSRWNEDVDRLYTPFIRLVWYSSDSHSFGPRILSISPVFHCKCDSGYMYPLELCIDPNSSSSRQSASIFFFPLLGLLSVFCWWIRLSVGGYLKFYVEDYRKKNKVATLQREREGARIWKSTTSCFFFRILGSHFFRHSLKGLCRELPAWLMENIYRSFFIGIPSILSQLPDEKCALLFFSSFVGEN